MRATQDPAGPASTPYHALLALTTVASGLMAGFFYAYACSVMIGLADASDATFIEAMQQINANVRNAWFGPVFFGSVALPAVAAITAFRRGARATLSWMLLALVFAIVAFGITLGVSVPLNDELAQAGSVASIGDLGAVRDDYEGPWVRWNIARTVASTLREGLQAEFMRLHRRMLAIVRGDAVCRRLMTAPGVGALVAVTFKTAVDDPGRFRTAKAVGAHFGLTPKRYQSGETDVAGGISKVGDAMVRTALYEAANVMLTRTVRFSALKRWALAVAKRRGMKRAKVALARKLAGILHRMWANGSDFRWGKEVVA